MLKPLGSFPPIIAIANEQIASRGPDRRRAELSKPATVSLSAVFAKEGLKLTSATEMMLTANQPKERFESRKKVWQTTDSSGAMFRSDNAQAERVPFDASDPAASVTIRAMEVKTFLVRFE